LGETISHFATQDLLQLACKTKKTNTNSSHSLYTYPHIFKPRRKKNTIEKQTSSSFSLRLCCVDLWKNTGDKKLNTTRCVMLIMLL
jgi:hypothetical protein